MILRLTVLMLLAAGLLARCAAESPPKPPAFTSDAQDIAANEADAVADVEVDNANVDATADELDAGNDVESATEPDPTSDQSSEPPAPPPPPAVAEDSAKSAPAPAPAPAPPPSFSSPPPAPAPSPAPAPTTGVVCSATKATHAIASYGTTVFSCSGNVNAGQSVRATFSANASIVWSGACLAPPAIGVHTYYHAPDQGGIMTPYDGKLTLPCSNGSTSGSWTSAMSIAEVSSTGVYSFDFRINLGSALVCVDGSATCTLSNMQLTIRSP